MFNEYLHNNEYFDLKLYDDWKSNQRGKNYFVHRNEYNVSLRIRFASILENVIISSLDQFTRDLVNDEQLFGKLDNQESY